MGRVVATPMRAWPSFTLRTLWVVGGVVSPGVPGLSWGRLFFQAIVTDGFVQGVRQHAEALADGGYFESLIRQGLGLGEEIVGELVTLTRRGRTEKRGGTFQAQFFAGPLDGDVGHAEGLGNLALGRAAVGDELAGEKPERSDVIDRMGEYRQVAIEVINLAVALFESEFGGDGGAAGREHRKLNLRHGARMDTAREKRQHGSSGFLVYARKPKEFMG